MSTRFVLHVTLATSSQCTLHSKPKSKQSKEKVTLDGRLLARVHNAHEGTDASVLDEVAGKTGSLLACLTHHLGALAMARGSGGGESHSSGRQQSQRESDSKSAKRKHYELGMRGMNEERVDGDGYELGLGRLKRSEEGEEGNWGC